MASLQDLVHRFETVWNGWGWRISLGGLLDRAAGRGLQLALVPQSEQSGGDGCRASGAQSRRGPGLHHAVHSSVQYLPDQATQSGQVREQLATASRGGPCPTQGDASRGFASGPGESAGVSPGAGRLDESVAVQVSGERSGCLLERTQHVQPTADTPAPVLAVISRISSSPCSIRACWWRAC